MVSANFKNKFNYKFYIIIIILILFVIYKLWFEFTETHNNHMQASTTEVQIIEILPKNIALTEEYTAKINAFNQAEIKSQASGILLKKLYKEGDYIPKDTPLFILDTAELKETLNKANANLDLKKHIFNRNQKLSQQKVISANDYETALADFKQAQAAVEIANINLNYAIIKSPIEGFVENANYSEGNLITANQSILSKVYTMDPCYIEFGYLSKDLVANYLKNNLEQIKINIIYDNGEIYPHEGKVDYISNIIDEKTGNIKARGLISNPDHILKAGQYVKIIITGIEIKNIITIPDQAVMQNNDGTFVYVVNKENKINIQPVKLGTLLEQGRIVTKGLHAGDKVVISGMIKVMPEQTVTTKI